MRICKQKVLSLMLAAVMLCACIPMTAAAEVTADVSPFASSTDTLSLPSYYVYQQATKAPAAKDAIQLTVDRAVLSDDNATRTQHLDKAAIRLAAAGYAEWTITVPANAAYIVIPQYVAEQGIGQTLEMMLTVDGEYPFSEATGLTLTNYVRILRLENGYQMVSSGEMADYVTKALETRKPPKLSASQLETLTIIAYYQPATKAMVEQIRGVDSAYSVAALMNKKLIEESGRLNVPGRPILYRTTPDFLRTFGLSSLEELPTIEKVSFGEPIPEQTTMEELAQPAGEET
jgi:segregation and condensation protein B